MSWLKVLAFYAALAVGVTYALWVFYLAVMNLSRAKKAGLLDATATRLGAPILFVGYALDALVNVCVMTLLFVELPQELTVTARLKRHVTQGSGWRQRLAQRFIPVLDPFDPSGRHIT